MTANIKQDDFLVGNQNSKGDAIAVGDADGLNALKVSSELVIFQMRLEWIVFKITEY